MWNCSFKILKCEQKRKEKIKHAMTKRPIFLDKYKSMHKYMFVATLKFRVRL